MEQCPICYTELEIRVCAPCDVCGWDLKEIDDFKENKHTYKTYEIYKGLQLTLCNFCDVDFGSYKPEYFGFANGKRIGFQDFHLVKEIKNPQIAKDKFCPQCSARLTFLNFLFDIRQLNSKKSADM